jgi:hypothetical protein
MEIRLIVSMSEAHEDAASLLPPSGGPAQAKTMPCAAFRAMIGADGEVELDAVL